MANTPLAGGNVVMMSQVVDPQTGKPSYTFLRWLADAQQRIQVGLNQLGELIGKFNGIIDASSQISGRSETIGTTVKNLTSTGQLNSLTNVASNVDLDHIADTVSFQRTTPNQVSGANVAYQAMIAVPPQEGKPLIWNGAQWQTSTISSDNVADGTGSPISGGKAAYSALVASGPATGKALVYNGSSWTPQNVSYSNVSGTPTVPGFTSSTPSQWLNGYNNSTGVFSKSQPDFSDLSGAATAAQLPALSSLSGAITSSQLPADVPVVSFGSGAPAGSSTEGYIYFDTSVTPYQGYVYHSAWNKFA